jgi:hypothetical protein
MVASHVISTDLLAKLRLAATLTLAASACRKEPVDAVAKTEPDAAALAVAGKTDADLAPANDEAGTDVVDSGLDAASELDASVDAGALARAVTVTKAPPSLVDLGSLAAADGGGLGPWARYFDQCPGCGMGGRLTDIPGNSPGSGHSVRGSCEIVGAAAVDRDVLRAKPRFLVCYNQALAANPTLGGKMVVHLDVGPSGEVSKAEIRTSTVGYPSLDACVRSVSTRLQMKEGTATRSLDFVLVFHHDHG